MPIPAFGIPKTLRETLQNILKLKTSKNTSVWVKTAGILLIVVIAIIGLTRSRYIGRPYSAKIDFEYVTQRVWSYNNGYAKGRGQFLKFDADNPAFILKEDTIFYKLRPIAVLTRLHKQLFFLEVKSLATGEEGSYISIEKIQE